MWANVINTAVGLVVGLATGFYFERRSSKATRQQNKDLETELASLRTSVYSVGAHIPDRQVQPAKVEDLRDLVLARARATQDSQGRLSQTLLTSYLFARGHRSDAVQQAINELCEADDLRQDGKWLEVV